MSKVRGNMIVLRTAVVSLGIILGVFCATSVAIKALLVPSSVIIELAPVIHSYYKQELCKSITTIVTQDKLPVSAQELYSQLVISCPLVKSVIIKRNPDRAVHITVQSMLPVMRIISSVDGEGEHSSYVFTDAHKLVLALYYTNTCLEHVPCLYVPSYEVIKQLEQVLKERQLCLAPELFDSYSITWYSPQKLVLALKKAPGCSLIVNQELIMSKKRVYAEQLCLMRYKKRGGAQVIDIRFGNYLVCT